jgi:hypothetical protein
MDYRAFGYEPDFDSLAVKLAYADSDLEHAHDAPDL